MRLGPVRGGIMWPRARALGNDSPLPPFSPLSRRGRGGIGGVRAARQPTARAVGYTMPPATRAGFIYTILGQETS